MRVLREGTYSSEYSIFIVGRFYNPLPQIILFNMYAHHSVVIL